MTLVVALDGVSLCFLRLKDEAKVNVCDTTQLLAGLLQCNSGKSEAAVDLKCVFVVYCVLESKQISSSACIVEYGDH